MPLRRKIKSQASVISWMHFVELEFPMLYMYTNIQLQRHMSSKEDAFWSVLYRSVILSHLNITKTRLFKYFEFFTANKGKCSDKKFWYLSYFCSKS